MSSRKEKTMIHTIVDVTTVGGADFSFIDDAAISAERSIMNGQQIDAEGLPGSSQNPVRVIIPFESIDVASTRIEHTESPEVEDDNCVVRTPAEDSGDDEGGRD